MSNLGPQQQNVSYDGLLQVDGGISSTLKPVQDGMGNMAGLWVSSTGTNALTATDFVASVNGTPFTGAVPRPISDGFGDYVSVKDFGAVGDGSTDDYTAIQAAINYVSTGNNGGCVYFPEGKYNIVNNTILITKNSVVLRGPGLSFPYVNSTNKGAEIIYTGTGAGSCAVKFYDSVGSYGYVTGVGLYGISIKCAATTETGVYINTVDSVFDGFMVYGQSGDGNLNGACVRLHQTINTELRNIQIQGDVGTAYCPKGIYFEYNCTTTTLYKCYVRQCQVGVYFSATSLAANMINHVSEAHQISAIKMDGGDLKMYGTWSEQTTNGNFLITTGKVSVKGYNDHIQNNAGSDPLFDVTGFTSDSVILFDGATFRGINGVTQKLFKSSNSIAVGNIVLKNITYASFGTTNWETGGVDNSILYPTARFDENWNVDKWRFTATSVTAGSTTNLTASDPVYGSGIQQIIPYDCVIVGYAAYYTSAVTSDGITIQVLPNGGVYDQFVQSITGYSLPSGSQRNVIYGKALVNRSFGNVMAKGDILISRCVTTSGFLPTGGNLTVDIFVVPISFAKY